MKYLLTRNFLLTMITNQQPQHEEYHSALNNLPGQRFAALSPSE